MSTDENEAKKSKLKTNLIKIFKELNLHDDKVDELVRLLEPGEQTNNTKMCRRDFCKAYTIELIKKYGCTADEKELMLVAFGLLKGFEFKPRKFGKRIMDYRKCSAEYNEYFLNIKTENRDSILKNIRNSIDDIIDNLAKELINSIKDGKLGLISAVPDQLRLPELGDVYNDFQVNADESADGGSKQDSTAPQDKLIINYVKIEPTLGEYFKKFWLMHIFIALVFLVCGWGAKDIYSIFAVSQTGDSSTPKDSLASDPPLGEPMENSVNIFGGENTIYYIDGGVYYINE